MLYKVTERRPVPTRGNVTRDETIKLTSEHARERFSSLLRQVTVWDAEHDRELGVSPTFFISRQAPLERFTKIAGRSSYFLKRSSKI